MNDYSRESLLLFLDYLGDKGHQNKNTVFAKKAAANNMLAILDGSEAGDLRNIDLDAVATRFNNLKGSKYTPESLQVYKSRTSKALEEFFRYKENPANFKSALPAGKPKSKSATAERGAARPPSITQSDKGVHDMGSGARTSTLNVPVALRPGCIIQLNGIPTDLSKAEAQKIANIVVAMASTD